MGVSSAGSRKGTTSGGRVALEKEIFRGLDVKDDSCEQDEVETDTDSVERLGGEEREVTDWSDSEEEDWELVRLSSRLLVGRR